MTSCRLMESDMAIDSARLDDQPPAACISAAATAGVVGRVR
jgi:hypothetical protein